ncbi:hypothetical protein LCGC14_0513750 [marine sediment metagenome]|uniref:Uncharacterized protein n=1 Tax=marine sediment metagenome TaxID=412755 RepID=A0A0F9V8R8_9ZZZZ
MTIDEQREAIREGLAITLHGQPNYWQDLSEYQQNHWRGKADTSLAFLTEQGAVLDLRIPLAKMTGEEELTATAPLIESQKPSGSG